MANVKSDPQCTPTIDNLAEAAITFGTARIIVSTIENLMLYVEILKTACHIVVEESGMAIQHYIAWISMVITPLFACGDSRQTEPFRNFKLHDAPK